MDQDFTVNLVIGIIIVTDIVLLWFFNNKLKGCKQLQTHEALQTKATITSKYKRNNKNSVSYMSKFTFKTWKGEEITGSSSMSRDKWDSLNEGDTIEIKYVRETPKIHCEIENIDRIVRTLRITITLLLLWAVVPISIIMIF